MRSPDLNITTLPEAAMQNQAAVEALYSATFVEDYLDYVENVPDDLQRMNSKMRELDMSQQQELLTELDSLVCEFEAASGDATVQRRLLAKMQLPLINSQDIGDSKIHLVQSLTDTIENKTRQLEHDSQNLDFGRGEEEEATGGGKPKKEAVKRRKNKEDDEEVVGGKAGPAGPSKPNPPKKVKKAGSGVKQQAGGGEGPAKRGEGAGGGGGGAGGGGGPKRGAKKAPEKERSNSPPDLANVDIDPDEPTYCLCDQVSYGEMIGCDNDLCPIEWFHFNCVQLSGKPKGKWFCPKCRGDKPTNMKPKAQFLKELEKYNKEKEDKDERRQK
jgi:inhibitor-of-growth protein 1